MYLLNGITVQSIEVNEFVEEEPEKILDWPMSFDSGEIIVPDKIRPILSTVIHMMTVGQGQVNLSFRGKPGTGKTTIAIKMAEIMTEITGHEWTVFVLQVPSLTSEVDMVGSMNLVDGKKGSVTLFKMSLFAEAISRPYTIGVLNEFNRPVDPSYINPAMSLTDFQGEFEVSSGVKIIRADNTFIIATQNVGYEFNVQQLDAAQQARFIEIQFENLGEEQERRIIQDTLKDNAAELTKDNIDQILQIIKILREYIEDNEHTSIIASVREVKKMALLLAFGKGHGMTLSKIISQHLILTDEPDLDKCLQFISANLKGPIRRQLENEIKTGMESE